MNNNLSSSKNLGKIIVMGFAVFAMYFGAGNIIFPPYLGVVTGGKWPIAFIGFIIGDVVLGVAAMVSTLKNMRSPLGIWSRSGKWLSLALGIVFFLFNGALFATPRTAAVAYEVGISPMLPNMSVMVWSFAYFALVWCLVIRPTKVVDYVGKFLTPALIVLMLILEAKGVFTDFGTTIRSEALVDGLFKEGLVQGYLTMDSNAGITIAYVALAAAMGYGYKKEKDIRSFILKAAVFGGILLTLLYAGLVFLGVKASAQYGVDVEHTQLLTEITQMVLGDVGKYIFGVMAALACLTTAIGITSSTASYFNRITKGKISYNVMATILCVFCACSSTVGVEGLISLCSPVINLFYPALITGIILTLFTNKIKNDIVFKACTWVAVIMGACAMLKLGFVSKMPFASLGLDWLVPVAITFVIAIAVTKNKPSEGWQHNDGETKYESYEELISIQQD